MKRGIMRWRSAFFWQEKKRAISGRLSGHSTRRPQPLLQKFPQAAARPFLPVMPFARFFSALPVTKTKAVVWLVPSDAILAQTVRALKDPQHPLPSEN